MRSGRPVPLLLLLLFLLFVSMVFFVYKIFNGAADTSFKGKFYCIEFPVSSHSYPEGIE